MAYLLARDTVNGAEGKGFVTRGGRVYEVAGFKNVRTTADIQSTDMRVVGTRKVQNKNNGVKLRGTANVYYGTRYVARHGARIHQDGQNGVVDLEIINSDRRQASAPRAWPITAVCSRVRSRCRSSTARKRC